MYDDSGSSHPCVHARELSHIQLFATAWTIARQAPLFMEFSRQQYWSGLLFPTPGDLPNPGMEPASPASLALAGGFFTTEPLRKLSDGINRPKNVLSDTFIL